MASTLERTLDSRSNALNFVRLVLASLVIFGHAADLSGVELPTPLALMLSEVPVDGFFAISGYLIARSWQRNPQWRAFLQHRILRIGPGYLVCLLVTGIVIAPVATLLAGRSLDGYWSASDGPLAYFLRNITLWIGQFQISGGPTGVPVPLNWDASLWTLGWEFLCYLGLGFIGALGVLTVRRAALPWLFAAIWFINLFGSYADVTGRFTAITAKIEPMDRFALMFVAGTLLFAFQDRVPMRADVAVVSGCLVVVGIFFTRDYRLLGALPLAYLMLWLGASLPVRLGMRNDISYGIYIYGFPVQQALVLWGIAAIGWIGFAVLGLVATIPIAALSWWLIERPSLRLKSQIAGADHQASAVAVTATLMGVLFVAYYVLGTFRA